jgi:hypothetical protein
MRPLIAAIDAGLVGIAIQAKTGSKAGGFVAAVAIYALIIYRHRAEQTQSESHDVEPGQPTLVRDNGEHQGSPTAALWHGFKWLAAIVILLVTMSKSGRVGTGPIAAAGLLLRRRRGKQS